ncbi:hypothetical protein pb186bvf_002386 [Paramecium bursaria]
MASKKEYSIEEHLYEMLLELHRLGCSEPFRLPVDAVALKALNYYDVILEPMDLSSLMANYKDGIYTTIEQVNRQLKLIISNCRLYNKIPGHFILKQCDKFENCYQTRWAKFNQQRIALGVPDDYELKVDVSKLDQMEFRKNRKKESTILAAEIQPKQKPKPVMTFEIKQTDQVEKQEKEELGTSIRFKIDKGFQQETAVELPEFLKEKEPKLQKSQSLQQQNYPSLQRQTSVKVEQQKPSQNIVKLPFPDLVESTKLEYPIQQIIKLDIPPPQSIFQQNQFAQQFIPPPQTQPPIINQIQPPIIQQTQTPYIQQAQPINLYQPQTPIIYLTQPTPQAVKQPKLQFQKSQVQINLTPQAVAQTIFNDKVPDQQIKSSQSLAQPQEEAENSTKVKFSLALGKPQLPLEKQKSSSDKKQQEYDPLKINEIKVEENIRKKSVDPPPKVQFPFDLPVDSTKFKVPVAAYDPLKPLLKPPIDKVQKNEKIIDMGQIKIENKKIDKEMVYDPLKNTSPQIQLKDHTKLQDFKQQLDANKESFKVSFSKQQINPAQQVINYGQGNPQSFQSPVKAKTEQETTPFSSSRAKKKIVDSDEESKPAVVPKPIEFKQIQKIKYTFKIDVQQSKKLFEENQQKKQDKLRRFILKLFQRIKINLDQQKINEKVFSYQTLLKCLEYPYQENVNLLIQWMKSEVVPLPFNHQASIYRYGQLIQKYCKQFKEPGDSEYKLYEKQFLDQLAKDIEDLKTQVVIPPPPPQMSTIQSITISQNQIKIKPIQENKVPIIKEFSYDVLRKYLKKIIPKQLKDKLDKVAEPVEGIKLEPFDLILPEQKNKKVTMEIESDESELIEQPIRKLVKFDKEVIQLNPIFNKVSRAIDAVEINDKLLIQQGDHYPILKVSGIKFYIINKNQKFYSQNEQLIQSLNDQFRQNLPRDQQILETQFSSLSYIYSDKKRYCDLYELYKFDNFVEIDIYLEFATKITPKPNLQFNISNIVSYQAQNNFTNYQKINHKYQLHIAQSEFQNGYINQNLYQVNEQFLKIMDGNLMKDSYAYHLSQPYQESECKFKIVGTFQIPFTLLSDLSLTLDSQQIFPLKRISKS